jgi:hypothetical protein
MLVQCSSNITVFFIGGNGNPNRHIACPFFLHVLECLCTCKAIKSLNSSDKLEEYLSDILHMTEEDYIKCVRSSLSGAKVFLQRKPYEVRVNPYMKVVLPAWKANHDLQLCTCLN